MTGADGTRGGSEGGSAHAGGRNITRGVAALAARGACILREGEKINIVGRVYGRENEDMSAGDGMKEWAWRHGWRAAGTARAQAHGSNIISGERAEVRDVPMPARAARAA